MALKVKAKEREIKIGKNPGVYRYVMLPELYSTLDQDKVIKEAAVALPGLGTMRFGLRAKAVENVNDVKTSLIKTRRIIFTPTQDLKDELADTAIQITCYDRNGEEVKRVTSSDPGTVEDPDPSTPSTGSETVDDPSAGSGTQSGGSGIIPTPTDPEDDQPSD